METFNLSQSYPTQDVKKTDEFPHNRLFNMFACSWYQSIFLACKPVGVQC